MDFVQRELGFALAGVGAKKWDADAATAGISQAQMDEINNYSDGVAPGLFEGYSADPDGWCELVWKDNGPEAKGYLPKSQRQRRSGWSERGAGRQQRMLQR